VDLTNWTLKQVDVCSRQHAPDSLTSRAIAKLRILRLPSTFPAWWRL